MAETKPKMKRTGNNGKNRYFHYQKEILNTISEPASYFDRKYKYIFVNSAFNKFFKKETWEIVGNTVEFLWNPLNFKKLQPHLEKCLTGKIVSLQFEGVIPGGEYKILEMHFYPHKNAAGRIDGIISTSKDITAHKKAEQALKESEARLKELNATKDKLFSIIGHDLQSPLSNIIGFSELIEKGYDNYSDEDIRRYNKIIYDISQSVSALLENLLTWARSQRNQIKVFPKAVSVHMLAERCYSLLMHTFLQKEITFNNDVPPETVVFADEEMLTIVVRNLISNALKFTHRKGSIAVVSGEGRDSVITSIKDSGTGIDPETLKHLFQTEGSQPKAGTEGETGTGLGLIICRDFIEKNGGEIWVESEAGQGSVFSFSLPSMSINGTEELTGELIKDEQLNKGMERIEV
jgi:PAS domain S-box-containing protein